MPSLSYKADTVVPGKDRPSVSFRVTHCEDDTFVLYAGDEEHSCADATAVETEIANIVEDWVGDL